MSLMVLFLVLTRKVLYLKMIKKLKQNISFPKLIVSTLLVLGLMLSATAVIQFSTTSIAVAAEEEQTTEFNKFSTKLCENEEECDEHKEIKHDCEKQPLDETNCGIVKILNVAINIFSGLFALTIIIVVIVAGIQYSASSGDPQAAAAAKKRITNALIAVVAFGLMYGFLQWLVPGGIY